MFRLVCLSGRPENEVYGVPWRLSANRAKVSRLIHGILLYILKASTGRINGDGSSASDGLPSGIDAFRRKGNASLFPRWETPG